MEGLTLEDFAREEEAKARLQTFSGGDPLRVNFYSGSGVALDRWQLRLHLRQFGVITKLFLRPDGKEGNVLYAEGANLEAVVGTTVGVAGDIDVFFVHAALPRVFLGGLPFHATEAIIREAMKPYGKVAKIERPRKKGRPAAFCFLTFCKRQHVIKILQEKKVTVIQTKVTVRMEGEKAEPDRIYDGDCKSWKPGRTLLLYGFQDPDELTEEDVRESLRPYGAITGINFVHKGGHRHPLCFVDFLEEISVSAAMKAPGGCVKGQIVGFMEVTAQYLAAISRRSNQRIREDEYDNDQGYEFRTDLSDKEKELAILSAVGHTAFLGRKYLPHVGSSFSRALKKRVIQTVITEGQKRSASDDDLEPLPKRVRIEEYDAVKEQVTEFVDACLEGRKELHSHNPSIDQLVQEVRSCQNVFDDMVSKKKAEEQAKAEAANNRKPAPFNPYAIHDESLRVFIQNLPQDATHKDISTYFSQFGELERVYINQHHQGYVLFELRKDVNEVLKQRHVISGQEIRVLKSLSEKPSRRQWPQVFVGGLPHAARKEHVAAALGVFGPVEDVVLPLGKNFGFVSFRDEATKSRALARGHAYLGYYRLVVKPAKKSRTEGTSFL